jgi:tRNA1Val (adenine37-N6)-methyltransferase
MLAQKSNADIVAIDIDENAAIQAEENAKHSPWNKRIEIQHIAIQDFAKKTKLKFDLIVSNPPYFVNSLKIPSSTRTMARHTEHLSHSDLLNHSHSLLTENGRLCLILPIIEGLKCIEMALEINLFCHKTTFVYPCIGAESKRLLLEFGIKKQECIMSNLTIETNARHVYTPEFIKLTKDYYLKF